MDDNITRVSKTTKDKEKTLPEGAKVINTTTEVRVEEIENGYIISKEIRTEYKVKGKDYSDYLYDTKKYYSEEDPLEINITDKTLADAFED